MIERKIIVKLNGGLGNQMFQYAFARAVSIKTGIPFELDATGYENQNPLNTKRAYELSCFKTKVILSDSSKVKKHKTFYNLLCKIFSRLGIKLKNSSYYIEHDFTYQQEINDLTINREVYFEGYWQSYKYFESIRTALLKEFTCNEELDEQNKNILNSIYASNSISLHIRRGDYVSNPKAKAVHGVCELKYYQEAIKYMQEHNQSSKIIWYVFSDDIEWVKSNLSIENAVYINNNKGIAAYKDIVLMSKCKHNIIANSSFSWWGAWLNDNPSKIVVAPKKWFAIAKDTQDLLPSEWVKL